MNASLRTLLAIAALCLAGPALAGEPQVHGFIVKLRDAPSHVALASAQAQGRQSALAVAEAARWNQLLLATGLGTATLRPVGRDQRLVQLARAVNAEQARAITERLAGRSEVAWAEPNVRERRLQLPNDPLFAGVNGQWWLQAQGGKNADSQSTRLRGVPGYQTAWDRSTGSANVVVAVLDTGITDHPELAGRVLPGYDFVSEIVFAGDGNGRDADPADPGDWVSSSDLTNAAFAGCAVEPSSWHGTIIATQLAAQSNNGVGVAGANWAARVLPVRVAGKCGAAVADIVDGMRWAAGLPVDGVPLNPHPARIINISFGGTAACTAAYQDAVNELRSVKGAVVVAAAGNEWGAATRPANCTHVVGVVALNRDGFKTNYSNFGSALAATGIATVGGDDADGLWGALLSDTGLTAGYNLGTTGPGAHGYAGLYGTSFASPVVSGALSLMLSVNPGLTFDQLLAGLKLGARPHVLVPQMPSCSTTAPGRCACTTQTCGVGILDVEQSLTYAASPEIYVAPVRAAEVVDTVEISRAVALGVDRAANVPVPPSTNPGSSGGGGGAMSLAWMLALALASGLLMRPQAVANHGEGQG
jgi:serine protease